jgi:hypothetical protein
MNMIRSPLIILLSILLPFFLLSATGCILNSEGTWCETIDANFHGCHKRDYDPRQYIAIIQGRCSEIHGTGRGMMWNLGEMNEWSFSGRVTGNDSAELHVTIEATGEERTVYATQDVDELSITESGHSTRRLSRYETCP